MEDFEQIIYEVVNNTAKITLNRPEKLNALTLQLQSELSEALWEADNDRDVRGHNTRAAADYRKSVTEKGLKATLKARDDKFGDGRARVFGPEIRDNAGNLIG